jgi:cell wall-associated NlpC family hydrolase
MIMWKAVVAAGVAMVSTLLALLVIVASTATQNAGQRGVVCAPPGRGPGDPVAGFAGNQLAYAASIVAAGMELGAPQRAHVIAVATAMQESQLLMYANEAAPESLQLPHDRVGSDHDSVGLFQQRAGWGTVAERMDPTISARLFYEALLALPDWESMPLTVAAQQVQISAFPDAYAKWEQPANEVVGSIAGIVCTGGGAGDPAVPAPNPLAQTTIDRAVSQVGVPYVWGGGNADGPTDGGFDCSGLMVHAFAAVGVTVPHQTQAIWTAFQPAITDAAQVQPGDMVLLSRDQTPTGIHHVGLYLGDGRVVHAPETGSAVEIVDDIWASPFWTREFIGAVRPMPATAPEPDAPGERRPRDELDRSRS